MFGHDLLKKGDVLVTEKPVIRTILPKACISGVPQDLHLSRYEEHLKLRENKALYLKESL